MNRYLIPIIAVILMTGRVGTARTYKRQVHTCQYRLSQLDALSNSKQLGQFSVAHYITYPSDQQILMLPKMVVATTAPIDRAEWTALENRIRPELEAAAFFWKDDDVEFKGAFRLNYDGIYTLIRALGGSALDYTDDITISGASILGPDNSGQFIFPMNNVGILDGILGNDFPHYRESRNFSRRLQIHLPLNVKNGLSFHIDYGCKQEMSGIY